MDFKTATLRGLPCGNYRLRILPGRDGRREPKEVVPASRDYAGREVSFVVGEEAPRLIDLGGHPFGAKS